MATAINGFILLRVLDDDPPTCGDCRFFNGGACCAMPTKQSRSPSDPASQMFFPRTPTKDELKLLQDQAESLER
jgi:hypothetical protein